MTALDNKGKPSEPQEASVLPHEAASASLARPRAIAAVQARAAGRASRIVAPLLAALLGLAVIYTLALGKSFLVPIALAFMTSLVLAPVVRWLEGMRIPRAFGAGLVVAGLLAALAGGVSVLLEPVSDWFEQAPRVLRQLERKVYPIKRTVEDVGKAADQVDRMASVNPARTVEIKDVSYRDSLYENAGGLLTGAAMATLLVYFFLSWGGVALTRVGDQITQPARRHRFLQLSRSLEGEVSKYLATITLINLGLGVVVAATLYALGMPNPVMWGSVAAALNYIPYLGAVATAVALTATALLTFNGLAEPAMVLAAFAALTIIEGQIVTPLMLSRRLALNPLVVLLSVLFWFWLWGIAGALMAVPILITFKLVGDRVGVMRPVSAIASR